MNIGENNDVGGGEPWPKPLPAAVSACFDDCERLSGEATDQPGKPLASEVRRVADHQIALKMSVALCLEVTTAICKNPVFAPPSDFGGQDIAPCNDCSRPDRNSVGRFAPAGIQTNVIFAADFEVSAGEVKDRNVRFIDNQFGRDFAPDQN